MEGKNEKANIIKYLYKYIILTFRESELRLYKNPFYYSCNFSVSLKEKGKNL